MPSNVRERARFGFDNADVARELARSWGLLSAMMLALGGQHAPADAAPHQLEAALLNLARLLANVVPPGAGSNDLLARDTLHILGLEDEEVLSRLSAARPWKSRPGCPMRSVWAKRPWRPRGLDRYARRWRDPRLSRGSAPAST